MPLLKNGKVPQEQNIKNVLEDIATKKSNEGWQLIENNETKLF